MKKEIKILVTFSLLTTFSWADISKKEFEAYRQVSDIDLRLKIMQNNFFKKVNNHIEVLKKVQEIATKKENCSLFTENILKLDSKDYQNIMKFHNSDLGKKVLQRKTQMYNNKEKMFADMKTFFQKNLSPKREELIRTLVQAEGTVENSLNIQKKTMYARLKQMPKEQQESVKKQILLELEKLQKRLQKNLEIGMMFLYKDFSDDEIEKIISYSKTDSGKKETKLLFDGGINYMNSVQSKISKLFKKKREESTMKLVCSQMKTFSLSLKLLLFGNSDFPKNNESLKALVKEHHLKPIPLDPWGVPLVYKNDGEKIEFISYGADKKEGGVEENKDIFFSKCQK